MDYLIENKEYSFLEKLSGSGDIPPVKDQLYLSFLRKTNGGLFFGRSLLMYGNGSLNSCFSLNEMNFLINSLYYAFVPPRYYFGCDVFGNQFGFSGERIFLLTIETGKSELLADSFSEWIAVIEKQKDYYTGQPILMKWEKGNSNLNAVERLCPKKPFIIGGDYSVDNLYSMSCEEVIECNAKIALQIFNLPDGTPIEGKVKNL